MVSANAGTATDKQKPRENIERPTSNTELRNERGFALTFDVRRWVFAVGCSSGFRGEARGEGKAARIKLFVSSPSPGPPGFEIGVCMALLFLLPTMPVLTVIPMFQRQFEEFLPLPFAARRRTAGRQEFFRLLEQRRPFAFQRFRAVGFAVAV